MHRNRRTSRSPRSHRKVVLTAAASFKPPWLQPSLIVSPPPPTSITSGGCDPTSTDATSALIRAQAAVYRKAGLDPILWPHLPAGHFGLGHGNGAHAPNEYYVIESANPKIQGIRGAIRSQVDLSQRNVPLPRGQGSVRTYQANRKPDNRTPIVKEGTC